MRNNERNEILRRAYEATTRYGAICETEECLRTRQINGTATPSLQAAIQQTHALKAAFEFELQNIKELDRSKFGPQV